MKNFIKKIIAFIINLFTKKPMQQTITAKEIVYKSGRNYTEKSANNGRNNSRPETIYRTHKVAKKAHVTTCIEVKKGVFKHLKTLGVFSSTLQANNFIISKVS